MVFKRALLRRGEQATLSPMSTILEADATGALHLPPSVLPHPEPGRRYRVATEAGQVVVKEIVQQRVDPKEREEWLKELDQRRERGRTGITGRPSQECSLPDDPAKRPNRERWLAELRELRERGVTGIPGKPSQEIWDELRGDR